MYPNLKEIENRILIVNNTVEKIMQTNSRLNPIIDLTNNKSFQSLILELDILMMLKKLYKLQNGTNK